jgi:hypothetical protein
LLDEIGRLLAGGAIGPHRTVSDRLEALWRAAELLMCWFERTPASVGAASDYLVSTKREMSPFDL